MRISPPIYAQAAILEKAAMIEVTPNAAGKIRGMIENDNPGGLLRLGLISAAFSLDRQLGAG